MGRPRKDAARMPKKRLIEEAKLKVEKRNGRLSLLVLL